MTHSHEFLEQTGKIAEIVDCSCIERMVIALTKLRDRGGRLFLMGVGGSAANASHAVNDFRKLCGIETYTPTDNVSELTARTNDEGWNSVFVEWLSTSHLNKKDAVMVLSVGGGNLERDVSVNLIEAIDNAKKKGAIILGIVGRDGGYTKKIGDHVLVIPVIDPQRVTPHTEAFQSVILHCLVSHPELQIKNTKW